MSRPDTGSHENDLQQRPTTFADAIMTDMNKENARLRAALDAAAGYLLNAKIDLETGAPKRTAIMTIEGGLKLVRAALNPQA